MQTIVLLVALALAVFVFIKYRRWESVKKIWYKITGKKPTDTGIK